MKTYIILLLLVLFIYINIAKSTESYDVNNDVILPSNVLDTELNSNIDISVITKMNNMRLYINDPKNEIPEIYKVLPDSYKNRKTYIQILYETYVDDFLDVYIVNRFNAHKFLNITYKYPSYKEFEDKYPLDNIKKNYDKIYKELLNPSIEFLYKNITNITTTYFDFTLKNIKDKQINELKSKFDKTDANNFNIVYTSEFKSYIIKLFKKINILYQNVCDNEDYPFIFTFKELTEDNSVEIFSIIDEIIENEIYIMKN
jgi:hypothetical protein